MVGKCIGWHADPQLISEVKSVAKERGVRPCRILDESLRAYLQAVQQPIDSAELVRRMLHAQGIPSEGIERLLH
jgi:hypothetical protein